MSILPSHIKIALEDSKKSGLYRSMTLCDAASTDLCSNDYLGLSKQNQNRYNLSGSTGSRLLSGNSEYHLKVEEVAGLYFSGSALLYNNGYQANTGILPCIAKRRDLFLYDEHIHASTRAGIVLSNASSWSFKHNNLYNLKNKLEKAEGKYDNIYILCEGLYSMRGSICPLEELLALAEKHKAFVLIDEAHSGGIVGKKGKGISLEYADHPHMLLRLYPLGKAFNSSGCIAISSQELKEYQINYSRSFIYSTALSAGVCQHILDNIHLVEKAEDERKKLALIIDYWNNQELDSVSRNQGPIQFIYLPREKHESAKTLFREAGINLFSIRYPSVSIDDEGFRVVLHSYNNQQQIDDLFKIIARI